MAFGKARWEQNLGTLEKTYRKTEETSRIERNLRFFAVEFESHTQIKNRAEALEVGLATVPLPADISLFFHLISHAFLKFFVLSRFLS